MNALRKYMGLGMVAAANLLLQFLFQWYIIARFGVGETSDAFFGAVALPQFVLLVLSGTLTKVLIPIIAQHEGEGFGKEAWSYFLAVGIFFGSIAILLLLTSAWWIRLLLPGFTGEASHMALQLTRIQLITMVLSALLSVLWAVQSAREHFYRIENTTILANLLSLALLYFVAGMLGIYAAAWATVLRVLLQILLLIRILGPYQLPDFRSAAIRQTWKRLRPLVAGNMYYKTDALMDRHFTSTGSAGQLTLLNLAQQLYNIGSNIIGKVLINTLIPSLSIKAASPDRQALFTAFKKRMYLLLSISSILYLLLVIAGKPLLSLIFSANHFDTTNLNLLWLIMVLLFGFWFASLLGMLTTGTFYARGDTVTPTRISVILFTLYLPVKIYVFNRFGVEGLALSISIHMLLNVSVQVYYLKHQSGTGTGLRAPITGIARHLLQNKSALAGNKV